MTKVEKEGYSSPNAVRYQVQIDTALLIARVGVAALMFVHGIPKMQKLFSGEPVKFAEVFGMSATMSLVLAVLAEVGCSLLVLLGLKTRLAVMPLIITMMVAVFSIHADDPFSKQELGLHYILTYLMLLIAGGGRYSLDSMIKRRRSLV